METDGTYVTVLKGSATGPHPQPDDSSPQLVILCI
jgi:hypothetical protein